MAAASESTHSAVLKRIYPFDEIERMMYENNPAYAMTPKKYDFFGNEMHRAIKIASTAGRSAAFEVAKANKQASVIERMLITTVENYSLYSVTGKLVRQTSNSKGALVNALTDEVDSAMDAMNRSFGYGVYTNKGGAIGRLSASQTLASTTVTLLTADDIVKIEKNQYLTFASTDGTSGSIKSGRVKVTAVDRDAGTFTVDSALSTAVPTVAQSDYIFPEGDFAEMMSGYDGWIPSSAPAVGVDSFFSLDRGTDPVRLAGCRISATTLQIEEAVKKALQVGVRNGCKTSHIFMNDKNFLDLDLSLGTAKRYVDTTTGKVGFTGIQFVGHGSKPVEVYPDPNCPVNIAYGVQMDGWTIEGPGQFPFIDATDGDKILREESSDAFEGRIKSYHQMICKSPGRNWRLALA
jgi:hypothetical protein